MIGQGDVLLDPGRQFFGYRGTFFGIKGGGFWDPGGQWFGYTLPLGWVILFTVYSSDINLYCVQIALPLPHPCRKLTGQGKS